MDFLNYLQARDIPYRQSASNPDEIALRCPFCPERGNPNDTRLLLNVNMRSGAGMCWHAGCGWRSRNAVALLLQRWGLLGVQGSPDAATRKLGVVEPVALPRDFQPLSAPEGYLDKLALAYTLRRGITHEQIRRRNIGLSLCGRYAYRVVFPVMEAQHLRGLVGRDFTGLQTPKYLGNIGPKFLYNFTTPCKSVILAEGVIKALRLERVGGVNCAALLGHSLTRDQEEQLRRSGCKQVVLWPDPDRAGLQGMLKVAERITEHLSMRTSFVWPVTLPADELPFEQLRASLAHLREYNWSLQQEISLYI